MRLALPALALVLPLAAQDIAAPRAGCIFNPATSTLHPIAGIPGASTLGGPVLSGIQSASYSPESDAALVARAGDLFLVTGVNTDSPAYQRLAGTSQTARIAWGRTSAVVHNAGTLTKLESLTGIPQTTPLAAGLPEGTVTALDYDEPAQTVYAAVAGSGAYKYTIGDGTTVQILASPNPSAIARAGDQVFVLDPQAAAIWNASAGTRFDAPGVTAIAASRDNQRLYAATPTEIRVYDLAGVQQSSIPTTFAPTQMERQGNLFILTSDATQPVWLLKDEPAPSVLFIPARPHNQEAQ